MVPLATVALLVTVGVASAMAGGPPPSPIEARLAKRLRGFKGIVGLAAKDLRTGETILVNADARFPTASAIKTAVMIEVFQQIAERRIRRDTTLTLTDADKVGEPVVLNHLHAGASLSVSDLLALMIAVSDNTATNMLVGLVGTANVDRRLVSHGLTATKLFRPTFRDGHADVDPDEEREFGLGVSTPREMARLMELIAEGKIVDRAACDEMLTLLRAQHDRAMIPRSLPLDEDGVQVANKTGEDLEKQPDARGLHRYVRVDAAIVEGARARYTVAIFTRQGEDTRSSVDNDALVTGAALSRMIYDHFSRR